MSVGNNMKYKGARMRTWGKWVSEIHVPGKLERLWLGSYSNPEAAALAHDMVVYFLRGFDIQPGGGYNFPEQVVRFAAWTRMSPRSVQRVTTECGMEVDAELINGGSVNNNGNNASSLKQHEMGMEWDLIDFDFQL